MRARTWLTEDELVKARELARSYMRDRINERVHALGGDFMLSLTCAMQAHRAAREAARVMGWTMGHTKENSPWL